MVNNCEITGNLKQVQAKSAIRSSIGGRLKGERKRLGLTQEQFARELGIHVRTQINYESGATKPDAKYLEALKAKGIDLAYVLTGKATAYGDLEMLAENSELFLFELCKALEIPTDKLFESLSITFESRGDRDYLEVIRRSAAGLLKLSPVLNRGRKDVVLDRDTLVDLMESLERELAMLKKRVTPLAKAHVIASLYRMASEAGAIDPALIAAAARSMPGG